MTQEVNTKTGAVLLLTAFLAGSSFFFIKLAVQSIPPLTIAASRSILAAIIVYGYLRMSGNRLPKLGVDWIRLTILGLLTAAIPYANIALGQVLIDSSLGGILFATIPIYSVLIAPLFLLEERFTKDRTLGAAIGFLGVILIIGPQALAGLGDQILGTIITLIAAFSYAAGGIYARRQTHLSPVIMASGQLLTASVILTILSIIIDQPWMVSPTQPAILSVIAVAVFSTAITVLLFFWLVHNAGATNTSLLAFFIPVAAVFLGVVALGETLTWPAYAGFGLILLGAASITGNLKLPKRRQTKISKK